MSLVDVRTPMTAPLASFSGESVVWNQPSLPPGPIVEYSSSPGSPVSRTRCRAVAHRGLAVGAADEVGQRHAPQTLTGRVDVPVPQLSVVLRDRIGRPVQDRE